MNILKSRKALSAGFHSKVFSSCVHQEQRQPPPVLSLSSFLVDSHGSFSREHLPLVSFPFPFLPLSRPSPFLFSAAHTISLLAFAVASRSINARFLRWQN